MNKFSRILIMGFLIEALIGGIGIWLWVQMADGSLTPTTSIAEARSTIFTVIGGAMGTFGGILVVLLLVAKRRES